MNFRSHWFQHDGVEGAVCQLYMYEPALRPRASLMLIIPMILLVIQLDHGMGYGGHLPCLTDRDRERSLRGLSMAPSSATGLKPAETMIHPCKGEEITRV